MAAFGESVGEFTENAEKMQLGGALRGTVGGGRVSRGPVAATA